ncbi:MAG TPA: tetratricopeptide repeat protein [Candidatus Manganitrophaceae bacterium]|nr:tetratricopeptide repeat protein [Candidatus Manganitrophaceae bacterium]
MFPVALGSLLAAVIVFLVYPFWRKTQVPFIVGHDASLNEERIDLEIEKQTLLKSLSELEMGQAQDAVPPADYGRLKDGYERRLAKILDRLDNVEELLAPLRPPKSKNRPAPSSEKTRGFGWTRSLALGLVVVIGASGMYRLVHWKIERRQSAENAAEAVGGTPPINPLEMVARLEKRLKENPDDLQGQIMAGRSYMALERWEEAGKTWRKVLELDPRNHDAHYSLGEVLIRAAPPGDRKAYEEALDHLEKALMNVPQDPSVLWAKGVALVHLDRYTEADTAWTEAYRYIPPGTESSQFVKKALDDLRSGRAPLF